MKAWCIRSRAVDAASAGVGAVLALLLFGWSFRSSRRSAVPADRHVKKNADPHHRLRDRCRTFTRPVALRRRARGLPAALPADPHDHARRRAGALPLAIGLVRARSCAAAGHRDHRRDLIASQVITLLTTRWSPCAGQAARRSCWSASWAAYRTRGLPQPREPMRYPVPPFNPSCSCWPGASRLRRRPVS